MTEWTISPTATGRFFVVHPKGERYGIQHDAFPTLEEAEAHKAHLESDPPAPKELHLPELKAALDKAFNK